MWPDNDTKSESSSAGRARPCQGRGRGSESRLSLFLFGDFLIWWLFDYKFFGLLNEFWNFKRAEQKSDAEFFVKMSIVVEEIDESNFWLDILIDSEISDNELIREL